MGVIIADSSVLILLEKIELLNRLAKIQQLIIPEEVYREVVDVGGRAGHYDALSIDKLTKRKIIIVKKVKDEKKAKDLIENYGLAKGESEAISLAIETKDCVVALDDLKAIRYCDKFNISFTTTINMILASFTKNIIDKKESKEMLKNLTTHGRYKNEVIFYAIEKLEGDNND